MSVNPIKPSEIQGEKNSTIPDFILESVNELLVKKWSEPSQKATFNQDELFRLVLPKTDKSRDKIFDEHLFDFEDIYRRVGWEVTYTKGAYYDTFVPYFTFKKSKTREVND